jgi:hypothetical protein
VLLHAGGWDELLLLAVALFAGVAIVMLGGKKKPEQLEEPDRKDEQIDN